MDQRLGGNNIQALSGPVHVFGDATPPGCFTYWEATNHRLANGPSASQKASPLTSDPLRSPSLHLNGIAT